MTFLFFFFQICTRVAYAFFLRFEHFPLLLLLLISDGYYSSLLLFTVFLRSPNLNMPRSHSYFLFFSFFFFGYPVFFSAFHRLYFSPPLDRQDPLTRKCERRKQDRSKY
uniref:Uncharacterized protein n=1 Tax=Palpitomonas bilix TaxID=652834 RepID=A0A7S3G9T8_9EUKA